MNYKIILLFFLSLFLFSCNQSIQSSSKKINIKVSEKYRNIGFALIYNDNLKNIKKLENRSLNIYHRFLKKKSIVKITNPKNGNSLIAEVKSNRVEFSNFYNSILSTRIAKTLDLDLKEPYVEIILVSKDSTFVAKKSKMFEEEKKVAEKAPVDGILINDLNKKTSKKTKLKKEKFSYSIKIADFYYKDSAKMMLKRINHETSLKNIKIIELSKTKYRVLIGPFNDIKSIKDSFEKMNSLEFENLEILKNV
tara:strand:- start:1667 stop:2419 length:753 start_codon:yes stop_codon:yes gene_type:complete